MDIRCFFGKHNWFKLVEVKNGRFCARCGKKQVLDMDNKWNSNKIIVALHCFLEPSDWKKRQMIKGGK